MQSTTRKPRWTRVAGPRTLGVVMIVKNEADNLPHLFRNLVDVADEVVVVDTGSTDDTLSICAEWGVKLIQEPWRHDFSAARNRSIEEATARYLLWLDGDDRLPAATQRALRVLRDQVLRDSPNQAYAVEIRNLDAQGNVTDSFLQTRIFPRRPEVRFEHPVHEQITPSLRGAGVEILKAELTIHHTGYADPEVVRGKAARNEKLLREVVAGDSENVHHLVHLAQTFVVMQRVQDADTTISDAIQLAREKGEPEQLLAELHALRSTYRSAIGNTLGAAYDLKAAISICPTWGVPYASLAQLRSEQGDWSAVSELAEAGRRQSFVPGVVGFRVIRARSNLELLAGQALVRTGQASAALPYLRAALDLDPQFPLARLELGQTLLEQEQYEEARSVLEPLGEDEAALERFVDVCSAIGLARATTGDLEAAGACLSPLLEVFAEELDHSSDVGPIELAEAMIRTGYGRAANHMIALFQKTVAAAA